MKQGELFNISVRWFWKYQHWYVRRLTYMFTIWLGPLQIVISRAPFYDNAEENEDQS